VHWFQEGHLGGGTEQDIEHMEIMLNFAYKVLEGSAMAGCTLHESTPVPNNIKI